MQPGRQYLARLPRGWLGRQAPASRIASRGLPPAGATFRASSAAAAPTNSGVVTVHNSLTGRREHLPLAPSSSATAETPVQPAGNPTAPGLASSASTRVEPLSGVADEQKEAGGNGSGAASPVSAGTDPILDSTDGIVTVMDAITTAAEET